ncbi:MAG: hypothetical protein BKP49_07720 [Treponema sp. CETP13]|nr:MAG: hypothetical protein BKP49_07720 [Treponema sp. CETP13]
MNKAIDCYTVLNSILVPIVIVSPKWDNDQLTDFTVEYSNKACEQISKNLFVKNKQISSIVKNNRILLDMYKKIYKNLKKEITSVVSFYPQSNPKYLIEANKMENGMCVLLFYHISSEKNVLKKIRYHKSCELNNSTDFLWKKLTTAVLGKNFDLVFQPQYSIRDDGLRGFEALIRWYDCELGSISPEYFIPIAEKSNYIVRLGWWIIETSLIVLKTWQTDYNFKGILSVNISPVQLREDTFLPIFTGLLNTYNINPNSLELEITESVLVDNMDDTIAVLNALSKQNVLISIDDFGTGYSSFKYIQCFPVKTLKLDKSLIDNITNEDKTSLTIANTIVNLGEYLGLETIAEGVEDEAQLDVLRKMKCKTVQGFLRGKPMNRVKCEELFKEYA